jgi:ligand-binding sensor domain-containing protein/serine phosphatase RsbU (regulator of sigma subunit)
MKHVPLLLGFTLYLVLSVSPLHAQHYKFRLYGVKEGLCHPFVYTINQDQKGYIWLGTGEGLCRYNGFEFYGDFTADSLPEAFVKKSYRDSEGNLWFGHNDGSITFYDGSHFQVMDTGEGITSTINDVTEDPQGRILFATQNQGMIIVGRDHEVVTIQEPFNRKLISSVSFTPEGALLVGAYDGLHVYHYDLTSDTITFLSTLSAVPHTQITDILYDGQAGFFWVGTQDEGLYALKFNGNRPASSTVEKVGHDEILQHAPILSMTLDREGYLWLSTRGEGVYKLEIDRDDMEITELVNFNEDNGLGSRYTTEVFQDLEGNIWISTYGNGLAGLFDEAFTFHDYEDQAGSTLHAVLADGSGFWMAGSGKLVRYDRGLPQATMKEFGTGSGLPQDRITALYEDGEGDLWIGTGSSGLYWMDAGRGAVKGYFRSQNSLENTVNALDGTGDTVWMATNNGVFSIKTTTGEMERFGIGPRIPHNKINDVFVDSGGNAWIATRSNGIVSVNTEKEYAISAEQPVVLEFVSITEDEYGNLWAATSNDGIFQFLADTLEHYSTYNGLKSAACYSIVDDRQGNIWVGHRLGLSKVDLERRIVVTYGTETGINGDCQPNASAVTADGVVLFGTSDGLVRFDTKKERRNLTPPMVNIISVNIADREYDFTKPIVLPYGIYKVRIEWIGLNYLAPEKVTYQYKLNGYDDWSDPVSAPSQGGGVVYEQYPRIEDGNYTFMLMAYNSENVATEVPVTFSLRVKLPIWKTWWFIAISILMLIAVFLVIIKYRERKAREFQEILQRKLDERTREVVMQKEEIEIKNKDITDSINYAQRIQASILPPISKLQDTFTGSFVFYQPRDIVSGDFYWYDQIDGHRFLIVCADSTGHGVPGAFMSMIGTTMIKDITARKELDSPAALLKVLDQEIMSALNQNIEAERSNDGMDVIVSEIDLETKLLRVSSAMRPMIIYRSGEQTYVRGSRSSVGGQYEKEDKVFETFEYQLMKGDKMYMFSDGYPDQFGGPLGKKFKMVRVKNMLRDIHEKPMEEQYNYIKNNFEIWKEDNDQVDDVLFMGIEI